MPDKKPRNRCSSRKQGTAPRWGRRRRCSLGSGADPAAAFYNVISFHLKYQRFVVPFRRFVSPTKSDWYRDSFTARRGLLVLAHVKFTRTEFHCSRARFVELTQKLAPSSVSQRSLRRSCYAGRRGCSRRSARRSSHPQRGALPIGSPRAPGQTGWAVSKGSKT